MSQFETLQEGLLSRDLHATQDLFEDRETNLRIIAKLKGSGGIKQGIWWQTARGTEPVGEEQVRKRVQRFEYVSKRPFVPGDPCDGTRDSCVWGCLWDAVRQSEVESKAFLQAINQAYGESRVTREMKRVTVQQARWEGICVPRVWTVKWGRRLLKSVRAINWSTLASMIQSQGPDGADGGATWFEVLTNGKDERDTGLAG